MHIITFLYSPESGMMISSMTWMIPLVPTTSLATICIPETKILPSSGLLSRSRVSPSILNVIKWVWMAAEHTECFTRWCLRTSIKSGTVRPNKPLQKEMSLTCRWARVMIPYSTTCKWSHATLSHQPSDSKVICINNLKITWCQFYKFYW